MKPYGVPRVLDTVCPDKADIKLYGFSTIDRCSRKDRGKNKARRIWKRKARIQNKTITVKELSLRNES